MDVDFMLQFAKVRIYVNEAVCESRRKQEAVHLSQVRDIQRDPGTESNEIRMSPRKGTFPLLLMKNQHHRKSMEREHH